MMHWIIKCVLSWEPKRRRKDRCFSNNRDHRGAFGFTFHVHPRSTKIRITIGNKNDAQSKMRTARARFIRRPVTLVSSALLVERRTLDSSLTRGASVLLHSNLSRVHIRLFAGLRSRAFCIQLFKSITGMKLTIRSGGSFARSTAARPSSINSSCHG